MFFVKNPSENTMCIRHLPLTQKIIGLVIILGGVSLFYFAFPSKVEFHCNRNTNQAILKQMGFSRSKIQKFKLEDIKGALLEESYQRDSEPTFRILLETSVGTIYFTKYFTGKLSDGKKKVRDINTFFKENKGVELIVVQDIRLILKTVSLIICIFGCLPLFFTPIATLNLDKSRNKFYLRGVGPVGFKRFKCSISDIEDVVVKWGNKPAPSNNIVFKFRDGKNIAFTYYGPIKREKVQPVVWKIKNFLS
jgi:hypothetical protein